MNHNRFERFTFQASGFAGGTGDCAPDRRYEASSLQERSLHTESHVTRLMLATGTSARTASRRSATAWSHCSEGCLVKRQIVTLPKKCVGISNAWVKDP